MEVINNIKSKIPRDYPYLNSRVRAKGSQLFDKGEYDSLLKMEPNGIARKLEEGDYSKEINELGSVLDGAELVETALKRNAAKTLTQLVDMSSGKLEDILEIYFRRYDINNLKRIVRLKKRGKDFERTTTPGFRYSEEELRELYENDIESIIEAIEFEGLVDYSDYLEEGMTLKEFERAIDKAYFDELESLACETGNKDLEDFIRRELEYENLRLVLRLKKYGSSAEEIREKCFHSESTKLVEACAEAEDLDECRDLLKESDWDINGSENLEDIEHALEVSRLRNSLKTLKSSPLGLAPIMAFGVAKMVEVENLRIIVQSKSTGVQEESEIRENLVISE